MRIINRGRRGLDHSAFADAVRAGHARQLLDRYGPALGIVNDSRPGAEWRGILPARVVELMDDDGKVIGKQFELDGVALDAQPELVNNPDTGIPAYLSNVLDPRVIDALYSPMKAAQIYGEMQKGTWVTTQTQFIFSESTGEVVAYGDYNNGGNAGFNLNFPTRQSFHYQTFTRWGQKEIAYLGLAQVDGASKKNVSSALVLNKFQNKSYFYGISGLANYGALNDPDLPAAIIPTTGWAAATADQVYQNFLDLFTQLVRQAAGLIDVDTETPMTCSMSALNSTNLDKTNQYGLMARGLIKQAFPGVTFKTAPEFSTTTGELVQLIVDEYEGVETASTAFTEKMRSHSIIQESSAYSQKKSQGTWGTIFWRPILVASMLG